MCIRDRVDTVPSTFVSLLDGSVEVITLYGGKCGEVLRGTSHRRWCKHVADGTARIMHVGPALWLGTPSKSDVAEPLYWSSGRGWSR
eukprot:168861-Alexandrium_andersonii.AAC.1